jgi:short-chain fatty acids transporter
VRLASGVILQFPFYAGMFGIIRDSGLTEVISQVFVTIADARSYPVLVYWYSGIVNYFVPSGGSKWAIEAPYLVEAAKALQVKVSSTVVAYSWGDMLTNIIQPFWALPILRAAGLDFRHILGYAMVVFALYGALVSAAFWLYPP